MRPLSLWRHEVRRAGWVALLPPVLAAGILVLVAVDGAVRLNYPSRGIALVLQSLLELALPLAAGMAAASLVGRDPAVELQLTFPTAYRTTILRRLAISAGWVAVIALTSAVAMVASGWWHRWPSAHDALPGQLTWLAPTLCLVGLGLLVGALSASPATATAAVVAVWFFDLAAAGLLQQHRWSRLLYLFATTRGTVHDDWTANRLTLLAAGAAMTAAGWLLLRHPSRLLTKETE
ncbi:MAG TPA: hypothetical protein VGC06_21975 [Actinomycetes bacterium]